MSFPLTMPVTKGFQGIELTMFDVSAISESPLTLSQQVQVFPGQRWSANVTLPPMKRPDAEPWLAFLAALQGRVGTFLLGDPLGKNPQGIATGAPLVNGANQSGNTLITDGWTHSITGIMKAGDYIQLINGSNNRLHKLLADSDSDSSGNATLTIWPSHRESPADNLAIIVTNTVGQFRLAASQRTWSSTPGGIYSITFPCGEAL